MYVLNIAKKTLKLAAILSAAGMIQACSNLKFQVEVDDPEPSATAYTVADNQPPQSLGYHSDIPAEQIIAKGPVINYIFQQGKKNIDSSEYFKNALTRELNARQLPVELNDNGNGQLNLLTYETIVHRQNGFAPLVTLSMAKLELVQNNETHRIAAVIKRAKVPIWTITEAPLVEATINQPQELLIKEVAAKINLAIFNRQLSDEDVKQIANEVRDNPDNEDLAYQKVYELGFSNNPTALAALREFSKYKGEYIRMAAISGMGMIGKDAIMQELKEIYKSGAQWQDRAMALKAIGDIHSEESTAFLTAEQERWKGQSAQEALWNSQIISLYLD